MQGNVTDTNAGSNDCSENEYYSGTVHEKSFGTFLRVDPYKHGTATAGFGNN